MSKQIAHNLDLKWRSDDIRTEEAVEFTSFFLPEEIIKGLAKHGFKYASPIQLISIPAGKIGKDLIIQSKPGTGKTLVFTIVALNMLLKGAKHPQVLIMAPTREIAFQTCQVIKSVGQGYKGLGCEYFIGGSRLDEDVPRIQGCQIIVGTPGRIKQLINYKVLKTAGIRLFVLDEADKLLKDESFVTDIDDIFRALPRDKQMIASSATYPYKLKRVVEKYFRDPLLRRVNEEQITLLGMVHFYRVIPVSKMPVVAYREKLKFLAKVLLNVKFTQCLVFCNMVSRVENLCVEIKNLGFATAYISSAREQEDRLKALDLLRQFKCKILVSSDVLARGIDAENVDLVINFDLPACMVTYFHRVGRAGRYGSKCASVTFITNDEIVPYEQMQKDGKFKSYPLADCVPANLITLQPKIKPSVKSEESASDDESNSSSDLSCDRESFEENGVKQDKAKGFVKGIELNAHDELPYTSKVNEFDFENVANPSDDKLIDSEVDTSESRDSLELQNQLFDVNSNPTISVKEDDDLSSTSHSMELESDKTDSPDVAKLKQEKIVSEVFSSSKENNLKISKSNSKESCENAELIDRKPDQCNAVTSVVGNTENCSPKPDTSASNNHRSQQITNVPSLVCLENDSEKSLGEKTIGDKAFLMNNESNTAKNFNPKSQELISSVNTFIQNYENCNQCSKDCSADSVKYSQTVTSELNDDELSQRLEHLRSGLSQFHYNVCKNFMASSLKDVNKALAPICGKEENGQVTKIEEQQCLKQNDGENEIQNSSLDSQLVLFSTPKIKEYSSGRSEDSSNSESSSECDKDKLIEHFNVRLASTQKVKPSVNQSSSSESSSGSELNSDTSVNSEDAMHMLAKEFNTLSREREKCYCKEAVDKNVGKAKIISNVETSNSSSSDSDSSTSIDSEEISNELEQKFTELIKAKKSDGASSKDTEEAKKLLREIKNTRKCFKGIQIVDSKKNSSSSDTECSVDQSIKESTSGLQNVIETKTHRKGKSVSKPHSGYRTKTVDGPTGNKITYYYSGSSSEAESSVDQSFKESTSGLQNVIETKTHQKGKSVSKPHSGCRTKTVDGPTGNKITYYYSRSSSETESGVDEYSEEPGSSIQVGLQTKSKGCKKNERLPKIETSQFDYSNANETSNPYINPASKKPFYCPPHSNHQTQPSYYTLNPNNRQYSQQEQNYANQGPFLSAHSSYQMQPTHYTSNLYNPPYPQQIPSHASNGQFLGTQSHHQMQNSYVPNPLSQPYWNECPLRESCQISKTQLGSKPAASACIAGCSSDNSDSQRNSNPSTNPVQSNYQMQPSYYSYNQCFVPSQHPCHPPNETCQSPACAAWYDIFYKQWQCINRSAYF